jgi:hypothetical protein
MRKIFSILSLALIVSISSCTSYEDKEYGPIAFDAAFEGGDDWLFEGPVEAITTIKFKPEDFGFSKENVGGMRLKSITITTENQNGFDLFDNMKVEVSSPNTDMLTIGVMNKVKGGKSLTIEGLKESKIENFNEVDEFFLHISGNLTQELEESFKINGTFTLLVESSENNE